MHKLGGIASCMGQTRLHWHFHCQHSQAAHPSKLICLTRLVTAGHLEETHMMEDWESLSASCVPKELRHRLHCPLETQEGLMMLYCCHSTLRQTRLCSKVIKGANTTVKELLTPI